MLDKDQIEKKIADLEKQRDSFIQNVNQQIGFFSGQIAAYEEMLKGKDQALREVKEEAS